MTASRKHALAALAVGLVVVFGGWLWLRPTVSVDADRTRDASRASDRTPPTVSTATAIPSQREPSSRTGAEIDATTDEKAKQTSVELPEESEEARLFTQGIVVDAETRAPVAGATVIVRRRFVFGSRTPRGKGITDAGGRFRFPTDRDRSASEISVVADGYAECLYTPAWTSEHEALGAVDAGTLRLWRGKRISGRVLAADGRTPVPDAKILVSADGYEEAKERTISRPDGTFTVDAIAPSPRAPYVLFALTAEELGWTQLGAAVGRTDALDVELVLRPSGAARVTIRDRSGQQRELKDATVYALARFGPLWPIPRDGRPRIREAPLRKAPGTLFQAETDASGVARFTALPTAPNGLYDFIVDVPLNFGWRDNVQIEPAVTTQVDLILGNNDPWSVTGVVHGADGSALGGAVILTSDGRGSTRTTADGRFRIDDLQLQEESIEFRIAAPGFATSWHRVEASKTTPLDIRLEPAFPIAGRVVDQQGVAVPGVGVRVRRESHGGQEATLAATTDANGRFRFDDAGEGEWTLDLSPPLPLEQWGPRSSTGVRGGDSEIVAVLRREEFGKVRVVAEIVDGATGARLAPDTAELRRRDESSRAGAACADYGTMELGSGDVTVERVKPGRWQLWVTVSGRPPAVADFESQDAVAEVRLRVVVGRPAEIRGR
jgi:carboxypeptidase family protein